MQGASTNGYGVVGSTSADGVAGVGGVDSSSGGGYGVKGVSTNGVGVYGSTAGVSGISGGNGVYAGSTGTLPALQVDGNAAVSGSLSKGGGSFQIDHPLDPAGKYLYHSFVESPDMMNVYNGIVNLDGDCRRGCSSGGVMAADRHQAGCLGQCQSHRRRSRQAARRPGPLPTSRVERRRPRHHCSGEASATCESGQTAHRG